MIFARLYNSFPYGAAQTAEDLSLEKLFVRLALVQPALPCRLLQRRLAVKPLLAPELLHARRQRHFWSALGHRAGFARPDQQSNLPPRRLLAITRRELRQGSARKFLVHLGQLACDNRRPRAEHLRGIGQRI